MFCHSDAETWKVLKTTKLQHCGIVCTQKTGSAGRGRGIVGNPAVIPPRQAVCWSGAPPYLRVYGGAGCEPRPRPRLTIVASTTQASQRLI